MYERPLIMEVNLETSTSCCTPAQVSKAECDAAGGVWLTNSGGRLKSNLGAPNCLTSAGVDQMVAGWLRYADTARDCLLMHQVCGPFGPSEL